MEKVLIGLISFNDLHYLKESLKVVEVLRNNLPADVVILDMAQNQEIKNFVETEYPNFEFIRHKDGNLGYAKGFNEILRLKPGYDFFLVYTSDVLLNPEVVSLFLQRMKNDENLKMCAGKMHAWDFKSNKKTQIIDTLGIVAEKRHHFSELGSGEEDKGQFDDKLQNVFGISGASFLIRTDVAWELFENNYQIFDDRMWMYKEDVDLAYRMKRLGLKSQVFPEVWAWHARTLANRKSAKLKDLANADKLKPAYGRAESYKNHILMLKNNFSFKLGFEIFAKTFLYEFLKASYMLVLHPKVLYGGIKTLLLVPAKRSEQKVSNEEILKFFK